MNIQGIEGMNVGDVQQQVQQGGKFVVFGYAMSFLVISLRRSSDVVFIKPGQSAVMRGLPYTLLSFFLGWWGFPWGLIYTPMVIIQNLGGGKDVTAEVMSVLGVSVPQQGLPAVQVK
jgi:hypothetical protein